MLKRLCRLFLCLLFALRCSASQDFILGSAGKRFSVSASSNLSSYGVGNQIKREHLIFMLFQLENDLIPKGQSVHINFNVYPNYVINPIKSRRIRYTLSCDAVGYYLSEKKGRVSEKIILNVDIDNVSLKDCLKLILYSVKNYEEVKKTQKPILAFIRDSHGMDKIASTLFSDDFDGDYKLVYSLSENKIDSILNLENKYVDKLLRQKFYRLSSHIFPDTYGPLDFYTQNDSFYLYQIENVSSQRYDLRRYLKREFETDTLNNSLFSFSDITYLASDKQNNYLVFDKKGEFYHIELKRKIVHGPFHLPTFGAGFEDYHVIADSFTVNNDTISMAVKSRFSYDGYLVLFNKRTGIATIDSFSVGHYLKSELLELRKSI